MSTYSWLNLLVLAGAVLFALAAAAWLRRRGTPVRWRAAAVASVGVLLLSAVFDSVIIAAGLVSYSNTQISGLFIGLAPIEDFAYPLAAGMVLPVLWQLGARTSKTARQETSR